MKWVSMAEHPYTSLRSPCAMQNVGWSGVQSAVPTCFKMSTIVPVAKKAKVNELIDFRPIALHTALSHLDKTNTYVRMLFIDYSSDYKNIVPSKLIIKLGALGLNPNLCNWVLDFLTGRPRW